MTLDSDEKNPDSQLYVEFYESNAKGYEGFVFVKIMKPGDKTNIYDQPATDAHKERFPRHWLQYQMRQAGVQAGPIGTPLELWNADEPEIFTENQMMELRVLGFQTVEQVALASDAGVQRIGMGGVGLRDRGKAYLANKGQAKQDQELADTKAQLSAMQQQMSQMMEAMQQMAAAQQGAVIVGEGGVGASGGGAAKMIKRKAVPDGQLDADAGNAGHG